jgi:hypothetical protein
MLTGAKEIQEGALKITPRCEVKRKDVLLRIPTLIIVVVVTTACFT